MTTPNQGIPPTVQTLLGIGAFQIGGGLTNFGQGVNENFVRQLIVGAGNTIWTGVENVAGIIDNIAQWLATLPLEALRMFQYFIPGAVPEQFIDIATAVSTIVSALSIQKLLMSLDDFEAWLTDTYNILLTEVHQILDAIGGLIITPITTRVAGFIDWLTGLAGFRTDTLGVLETIGGQIDDLIFGVGGTVIGDVVSAIGHGVQAGIDIAEVLSDLGITTIAELIALITQGVSALGYVTTLIASIPGAVDTTDVGTAINSGVTALTRVLTLISEIGGTNISDVSGAIIDAGTDAASALSKIGDILTAAGVASEAALGSAVSTVITELQDLLDGIANALGEIGSGFTIENIVTNLQNIPIENIVNLPGYLTNMAVTGLYDAAAGFTNTSTSLLKNLTAAGATLGQFNAAALHGAINTATTLGGQALSNIFNGTGHFIGQISSSATGALNTAVTVGGTTLSTLFTNINSSGQILGSGITGAINTAATLGGTALSTLATNWNAAVTDINSLISGVGGSAISDVTTYLQNVPNTAVLGLTGFGTNIGNTIQALSDGVWQGLRAFLGIPSGVGPPQVSSAAQQVRVDLNNASDIASAAALFQANQSITKQSYLSIDPSADPVFPLANISGASPTTVPVTQSKSVMGIIGLPDNGLKKSLVWLGGSLTNIDAVFVNLYKVNTTTGVFTRTHASSNIIGALTSPGSGVAWQFYNLPMTAFFPTLQGDWYVAEIVVVGTGTYNVVGVSNSWMPSHPSVYPKGLGAARAMGNLWKAKGVGNTGGTKNPSWNHTFAAGDNCVVVDVSVFSNTSAVTAIAATCGGAAMTLLKLTPDFLSSGSFAYIATLGLIDPVVCTGTKSIAITTTGGGTTGTQCAVAGNSASYPNIASFGTAVNTSGSGTTATQTVSSGVAGNIIHQAFSHVLLGSFSAYNQDSIHTHAGSSSPLADALLIGNQYRFSSSLVFTATMPSSGEWCGVAVPLVPSPGPFAPPSSIAVPTYDANVPWIALAGAAGRAQHPAETAEFETAGTFTYNVPSWVIDGDYIDIVPIGAGAGGSYLGDLTSTVDASYKGGGPGQWSPIRLRYGDAYDIPTGTTTFTVNVGAGGSGASNTHPTHSPAHGSAGDNTTVVITGYPTITANGGSPNGTTIDDGPYDLAGDTAGNVVHEGVTYFGGAVAPGPAVSYPGPTGNSPGGGGGGSISVHSTHVNGDPNAGAGAPGACYITAVQG